MGSSLRARILSWDFNLVGLPFPPACAVTARTGKVLDKCLLNGYMNKIENRKCHKSKCYKSAMKIQSFWSYQSGVRMIKEGMVEEQTQKLGLTNWLDLVKLVREGRSHPSVV